MSILHRFFAVFFFVVALIGIVIPGLPTVCFVLLSAWFANKGWPEFEAWLLAHPYFGRYITDWRQYRAIPRRAKWASSIFMSVGATLLIYSSLLPILKVTLCLTMLIVACWIWTRSEGESKNALQGLQ